MTIIRNDRNARANAQASDTSDEELEIDYRWHPTEDEYVSPLTAEQWAELLGDESFANTDQYRSIVCLHEYGGPATFQQLSIKYRGTMGRYRRWLSEAAEEAGRRFGLPAPMQNQLGMDEWWPLLYRTRATGKPGAGVFEMMLRDEVEAGFGVIDEQEKLAKRAENARQLQRIEQLERARKEERDRRAAEAVKAAEAAKAARAAEAAKAAEEAKARMAVAEPEPEPEAPVQQELIPTQSEEPQDATNAQVEAPQQPDQDAVAKAVAAQTKTPVAPPHAEQPQTTPTSFPALQAFLDHTAEALDKRSKDQAGSEGDTLAFDLTAPVDYALRYADRLRQVFLLMQQGNPNFTAAAAARELGDESVEQLQNVLNGQLIPSFAYLNKLRERLFINLACLEVPDGRETSVPAFLSLQEHLEKRDELGCLLNDELTQIAYVVDDSDDRRTGVVFCYGVLRCALLTREAVEGKVKRGSKTRLNLYSKMVGELDKFARAHDVVRTTHTISAQQWDELVAGTLWAGSVL